MACISFAISARQLDAEIPGPHRMKEVRCPLGEGEPKGRKKRRRAMTEAEAKIIVATLQIATSLAELITVIIR